MLDIIQVKTTVSEASRSYDLPPSEVGKWVDDAKQSMKNALRANPLDVKERYELQIKGIALRCSGRAVRDPLQSLLSSIAIGRYALRSVAMEL